MKGEGKANGSGSCPDQLQRVKSLLGKGASLKKAPETASGR